MTNDLLEFSGQRRKITSKIFDSASIDSEDFNSTIVVGSIEGSPTLEFILSADEQWEFDDSTLGADVDTPDKVSPTLEDNISPYELLGDNKDAIELKAYGQGMIILPSMIDNYIWEDNLRFYSISRKLQEAISDFYEDYLCGPDGQQLPDRKSRFDASYKEAEKMLKGLPHRTPIPELVVEPNGEIGLEWRKGEKGFLISFQGKGLATYAGYLGENNQFYGVRGLEKNLNKFVLELIKEIN